MPRIASRDPASHLIRVIVETPAGSRNKYKYDEELGLFRTHKVLPLGASFPFDFGFVPGTRAEDGDPVDVIVIGGEPTFPGCLTTVRLLGVIEAEQKERGKKTVRNDRLLGITVTDKIKPRERTLADVPRATLDQLEHFFISYNEAEGREFVVLGRKGPEIAERRLAAGERAYMKREGFD